MLLKVKKLFSLKEAAQKAKELAMTPEEREKLEKER